MEDWMFLIQNLTKNKIYIIDRITITMNDHEERSMKNDNQQIIQRRLLAADWLKKNVPLSPRQQKTLDGYSYYFCAIHSYLDCKRNQALYFSWKFIRQIGFTTEVDILFLKIIIGYRMIQKLKS